MSGNVHGQRQKEHAKGTPMIQLFIAQAWLKVVHLQKVLCDCSPRMGRHPWMEKVGQKSCQ